MKEGSEMPCETRDWKAVNCVLALGVSKLSSREPFSPEINETFGEGGALNADYRTVEAVAMTASLLGLHCLEYEKHFRFKTGGGDQVSFDFSNEPTREIAEGILAEFLVSTE